MKPSNGAQQRKHQKGERTIQDYVAIIARGKWIALGAFLGCIVASLLYYKLADPVYHATSTVLIDQKIPNFPVSMEGSGRQVLQNIKNELEILKSHSIADTVVARLLERKYLDSLARNPIPIIQPSALGREYGAFASSDEIIGRLSNAVDFDPLRETDIIKITVKSTNPEEAALIANLYAQTYFNRNIYTSRSKSRALREFLAAQVRDKRSVLDDTESSLQQYMESQGIVSLDDESKKIISQLAELEATRDATDINLKSLSETLSSYKEQFPQQEADVARLVGGADDQYIRGLQKQIADLEVQRDVTIAQNPAFAGKDVYNDRLKEIDDQIDGLKIKLQKRTNDYVQNVPASKSSGNSNDPTSYLKQLKQNIVETGIEMQSLEAKKRALDGVIRDYSMQFDKIPRKSMQFARLQRSKISSEKLFLLVEAKYNEAAIAERSEFGYISIMDPAVVPNLPASPKFLLSLFVGGILGLVLGLGLVFAREALDVRIQSPEDLKKRGLTLLAAIMNMDEEIQSSSKGTEGTARVSKEVDSHLITLLVPFSPIAESYRLLRTSLQFSHGVEPPQTMVVTSPNPSEGKTTTVSNLAVSFAQTGKRVLLIDCDLRKPSIHKVFSLEMKPGVAELLFKVGAHELSVQAGVVKNLDIICAGALSPNPSEVLGSKEMRTLIEQAKREYDVILLDASPMLAATDASILATMVDGVVMVASAGDTRIADIDRSVELLESVGGRVLGFVLNRLDLHRAYGIPYGKRGYHYYGYSYTQTKTNGKARAHQKTDTE